MRVLYALEWDVTSIGGVQTHVKYLAYYMRKLEDVNVLILTKSHKKIAYDTYIKAVTVDPIIPIEGIVIPPNPLKIKEILKEERPDVIHAHHAFTSTSLLCLSFAEKLNIHRVLTNHSITIGYDYEVIWNFVSRTALSAYKYYISKAEAIISVSQAANRFIKPFTSRTSTKIVIPNGVDVYRFQPPKKEALEPNILFVGRLVHRKGPHVLIKAFKEVVTEFPEAKLFIVGEGYMKPYLAYLAGKLNLKDKIRFLGSIPDNLLPKIYREAVLVTIPSLYSESFCIVAIEALASGRPVVASNTGGLPEVVENDVCGFLVQPGNAKSLAGYISIILSDHKLHLKLARNARKIAEQKYSWENITSKVYQVYESLLW
ncbi:hypothetical protein DRN86_02225 [Candidatus Geothermarchaeota archaeon]|nr:MAG: hypothetical protein DRN86_02225 [Candidatus Geothermarchaeota archaeon]